MTPIDAYLAAQPAPMRHALERVRRAILKAVPDGEETIAYRIPTIKLHGRTVLHFAGWKNYYSIYPANTRVVEAFGDRIRPYLASKSTLHFPLSKPVPVKLLEEIAKFRAAEIPARSGLAAID
jgi:uncharacterized protein YdhG (YjbR/CyaY superfamily)